MRATMIVYIEALALTLCCFWTVTPPWLFYEQSGPKQLGCAIKKEHVFVGAFTPACTTWNNKFLGGCTVYVQIPPPPSPTPHSSSPGPSVNFSRSYWAPSPPSLSLSLSLCSGGSFSADRRHRHTHPRGVKTWTWKWRGWQVCSWGSSSTFSWF